MAGTLNVMNIRPTSGTIQSVQKQEKAREDAEVLQRKGISQIQTGLLNQAKQFETDVPKLAEQQVSAQGAQLAQDIRQQQRMIRSQAVAGGQAGSGQMKIKFANLSAGAKYAYMAAKSDIETKMKSAANKMMSDALAKSQSLAGLSLENAQEQYNLELARQKQDIEAQSSIAGGLGSMAALFYGSQKDKVPTNNTGVTSYDNQLRANQSLYDPYYGVGISNQNQGLGGVKE